MLREVAAVVWFTLALAAPASTETVVDPQAVGDEYVRGHDITKVRMTNSTGAVTLMMQVGRLHRSDSMSVLIATGDVRDYNYSASGKLVGGAVIGDVRTFHIGTPESVVTCTPDVRFDFARDRIRMRAPDTCFPGSDLSKVLVSFCLGVRGHNNCGDYTGNYVVHRD